MEPLWDHLQATTGEAANKDDLLGCLTDVNEASAAGSAWREVGNIHIALLVNLHNNKCLLQTVSAMQLLHDALPGLTEGKPVQRGAGQPMCCSV